MAIQVQLPPLLCSHPLSYVHPHSCATLFHISPTTTHTNNHPLNILWPPYSKLTTGQTSLNGPTRSLSSPRSVVTHPFQHTLFNPLFLTHSFKTTFFNTPCHHTTHTNPALPSLYPNSNPLFTGHQSQQTCRHLQRHQNY